MRGGKGAEQKPLRQRARAGPSSYNLSVSLRSTAPLVGEPLAKPFALRGLPRPLLQGATTTTAASGGNREELLGQRPAGCKRQRSRRWVPQPGQWHRVSDDGEVVLRRRLWPAHRRKKAPSEGPLRGLWGELIRSDVRASRSELPDRRHGQIGLAVLGKGADKEIYVTARDSVIYTSVSTHKPIFLQIALIGR